MSEETKSEFGVAVRKTQYTILTTKGQPREGGDFSHYQIFANPAGLPTIVGDIRFQSQNPHDGVNGVVIEDLLAASIHRLECFQSGKFPHSLNETALFHLRLALVALDQRTAEREERQVDGTQVK